MKFLPLIILAALTSCLPQEPKKTTESPENVNRVIQSMFNLLDSLYPYITVDGDSLNNNIANTLIKYREAIMEMPDNPGFREPNIVHSPDQQFCTVSWDTRQGGTNIDNRALILFNTSKGIDYRYPADTADYASTQILYTDIYELQTGNKVVYIARGYGRGSSAILWEQLTAWSIRNDSLIPEPIFPDWYDLVDGIRTEIYLPAFFIEFDMHYISEKSVRPETEFAAGNKKIRVPLPNDKGGWSDRFCWLEFDGDRFKTSPDKQ